MESLLNILEAIDGFVWGPPMLVILVGTGIICTFRTGFLCWRNLGYSLKTTLSRESIALFATIATECSMPTKYSSSVFTVSCPMRFIISTDVRSASL